MTKVEQAFEKFFEYQDKKEFVSSTSAKLFAVHYAQLKIEELQEKMGLKYEV